MRSSSLNVFFFFAISAFFLVSVLPGSAAAKSLTGEFTECQLLSMHMQDAEAEWQYAMDTLESLDEILCSATLIGCYTFGDDNYCTMLDDRCGRLSSAAQDRAADASNAYAFFTEAYTAWFTTCVDLHFE